MSDRYKVTVVHGESKSVYYVVDTQAPEDEQPCIIASADSLGEASSYAAMYERGDQE